jgi:hypothetical protein
MGISQVLWNTTIGNLTDATTNLVKQKTPDTNINKALLELSDIITQRVEYLRREFNHTETTLNFEDVIEKITQIIRVKYLELQEYIKNNDSANVEKTVNDIASSLNFSATTPSIDTAGGLVLWHANIANLIDATNGLLEYSAGKSESYSKKISTMQNQVVESIEYMNNHTTDSMKIKYSGQLEGFVKSMLNSDYPLFEFLISDPNQNELSSASVTRAFEGVSFRIKNFTDNIKQIDQAATTEISRSFAATVAITRSASSSTGSNPAR